MSQLLNTMENFSAAEEFFDFLGVEYEPQVVHVNRLHILKRFQQYMGRDSVPTDLAEADEKAAYKKLLEMAYADFVKSNASTEKVFKVFQEADGVQSVSVKKLKASLDERRA
jgi:nitrogenase-stabilizing/protective protein